MINLSILKKFSKVKIILLITLIISTLLSAVILSFETYGIKAIQKDIYFEYKVNNETTEITLIPKVNVKDLEYSISFESDYNDVLLNSGTYERKYFKEYAEANVPIVHKIKTEKITENIKTNNIGKINFIIKNGKIQNKDLNRSYDKPSDNCTFDFTISKENDKNIVYCRVTNKTNKTISAIKDFNVTLLFQEEESATLNLGNISFEEPLDPKETKKIIIDSATGSSDFNIDKSLIENQNKLKATKYENQKYVLSFTNGESKYSFAIISLIALMAINIIIIAYFLISYVTMIIKVHNKKKIKILNEEIQKQKEATQIAQSEIKKLENEYETELKNSENLKLEIDVWHKIAEEAQMEIAEEKTKRKYEEKVKKESNKDFRQRYEKPYRCKDGDYVRSKAEREIDNFLYDNKIWHIYEPELVCHNKKKYYPDFLLTDYNLYIEYFGRSDEKYIEKKEEKIKDLSAEPNINFEYLEYSDDSNITEKISNICKKYNIPLK